MSFANKYSIIAFWCLVLIIFISVLLLNSSGSSKPLKYPGAQVADDADNAARPERSNIVFLYCGRWHFLRIQLPHLYRDLRKNGGVIDKVHFMMVGYTRITLDKLINFTEAANSILMEEVFSFHFMGYIPYTEPAKILKHNQALYEKVEEITRNPFTRFFKLDDDVVYIHPKAFVNMISMKKSDCGFHYFNIAGSNWRCSWLHQEYGVYRGLNPKNLTFQYDPYAKCGWKRLDCAKLTLETFLQLHNQSQLERYFFDVEHLTDRKRFSINGYMLDNYTDALIMKKMLESGPHEEGDELFLAGYFKHTTYPPCVIGKALVVHFGYHTVNKKLVEEGYLKKFEDIVKKTKQSFHLPTELWQLLDY